MHLGKNLKYMSKLHLSEIFKYGEEIEFEDINFNPVEIKKPVKKIKQDKIDPKRVNRTPKKKIPI